ncbi:hypothetical protein ABZ307_38200 [Streptomyces griseorubiginosus]|uniref:hypothetical protein n=1 Tax=Streptomyces griseorubiginosus TaxID=67304 RepID=UPI00339FF190
MAADERIDALCPVLAVNFDQDHPDLFVARERLMELVGQMMQRAREAGQLRPDVESGDLKVAVSQFTGPLPGTARASTASCRHLQMFPGRSAGTRPLRSARIGRDRGRHAPEGD